MVMIAQPIAMLLVSDNGSSLIDGLVIWCPKQKSSGIVPYAPAIRLSRGPEKWALKGCPGRPESGTLPRKLPYNEPAETTSKRLTRS